MKVVFCTFLIVVSATNVFAANLTSVFQSNYYQHLSLNSQEKTLFQNVDIYLVPGLMSEVFLSNDRRSQVNFASLTGDYFGQHKKVLTYKYGFSVKLLSSSSRSVDEIKQNIHNGLEESRRANRKAVFMTHSLGGLALLEELVTQPQEQEGVAGIIFLQSPFYGSSIADFFFGEKLGLNDILKPVLPFVNMSAETVGYLSTESRKTFMASKEQAVAQLVAKIPLFTVSGVVNGEPSMLTPAVNLMSYGCFNVVMNRCYSETLLPSPYSWGDGLVSLKSSLLPDADYVILEGVDHAETVVNLLFTDYEQTSMTEALFKILAAKVSQ
ncbi:MAG: hypothetical protein J7501_04655 [Bdellovibrio sp.]|nr:hypothetical protein [Bdellovibrio sp.]